MEEEDRLRLKLPWRLYILRAADVPRSSREGASALKLRILLPRESPQASATAWVALCPLPEGFIPMLLARSSMTCASVIVVAVLVGINRSPWMKIFLLFLGEPPPEVFQSLDTMSSLVPRRLPELTVLARPTEVVVGVIDFVRVKVVLMERPKI